MIQSIYLFLLSLASFTMVFGDAIQPMKNLELKVQLDEDALSYLSEQLKPYFAEILLQTDTYFVTHEGRFKLREEEGKNAYLIRYERPDQKTAKQSDYLFYPIHDPLLFRSVMNDCLKEEVVVKKQRSLYFPKPDIRIHLDEVVDLGCFLEIEIILSESMSLMAANQEMEELQKWLQLDNQRKISKGYRELLLETASETQDCIKDLEYYKNQNKIFWVIANDLSVETKNFYRYDVIPCLFVEEFADGTYGIIQLDPSISEDPYQYTAWRKFIGLEHKFRVEVLLIDTDHDKLYTLQGKAVPFESLTRSSRLIYKNYLAPFSRKY